MKSALILDFKYPKIENIKVFINKIAEDLSSKANFDITISALLLLIKQDNSWLKLKVRNKFSRKHIYIYKGNNHRFHHPLQLCDEQFFHLAETLDKHSEKFLITNHLQKFLPELKTDISHDPKVSIKNLLIFRPELNKFHSTIRNMTITQAEKNHIKLAELWHKTISKMHLGNQHEMKDNNIKDKMVKGLIELGYKETTEAFYCDCINYIPKFGVIFTPYARELISYL